MAKPQPPVTFRFAEHKSASFWASSPDDATFDTLRAYALQPVGTEKDGFCITGPFDGSRRYTEQAVPRNWVGLDYDALTQQQMDALLAGLKARLLGPNGKAPGRKGKSPLTGCAFTTFQDGRERKRRLRVLLLLDHHVQPGEYGAACRHAARVLDGLAGCQLQRDTSCDEPVRLLYTARGRGLNGKPPQRWIFDGAPLCLPAVIEAKSARKRASVGPVNIDERTLVLLESALGFTVNGRPPAGLDSDEYDDWFAVLMALRSTGHARAEDLARRWSQRSAKYSADAFEAKWDEAPHSISVGSIFHRAVQAGWIRPQAQSLRPALHAPTAPRPPGPPRSMPTPAVRVPLGGRRYG